MHPPPPGTVERWAWDYVSAPGWEHKLAPPPLPEVWETEPPARRMARPGRGPEFVVASHGERSTGKSKLRSDERRARLVHTFLHHELQAAELMAWAVLAFPSTPTAFRRGLLRVMADEIRHMGLYRADLARRGVAVGGFPVRDWFWERVPSCPDPASFVATMGIGFEGGNLDHASRFAERFRAAGDLEGAAIQERVMREEVAHVRFAVRWFRAFADGAAPGDEGSVVEAEPLDFARWRAALPAPLSPLVMRGDPIAREARARAGLDAAFVEALVAAATNEGAPGHGVATAPASGDRDD